MATAEAKVTREVTLHLSQEEAVAILTLCSNVGGSPTTSRRGLTDKVGGALKLALSGYYYDDVDVEGSLYFKDLK